MGGMIYVHIHFVKVIAEDWGRRKVRQNNPHQARPSRGRDGQAMVGRAKPRVPRGSKVRTRTEHSQGTML